MSQNELFNRWRIRITGASTHEWEAYDGSGWKSITTLPVHLDQNSTEGFVMLDQNWLSQMGSSPEALTMYLKPRSSRPPGSNPFGAGQELAMPPASPPAGLEATGPRWHIVGSGSSHPNGFPSNTDGATWKFFLEYGDEQVDPEMVVEDPNNPPDDD